MPSGGGGGGRGGNNNGGRNQYNPNYRRNPFGDIIQEIAKRIAKEKNDEKESVPDVIEEEEDAALLGGDPATWTPSNLPQPEDGENYPGKNGAGTYNLEPQPSDGMPGKNGAGTYNP